MTKIFNLDQIKEALKSIDTIQAIEKGFIAYSQGKVVVPPVGELIFEDPPGDMHIKYGYIKGNEYYVVKIATGSYENYKLNLPTTFGLMLVFRQKTGELASILLDEGYLTNIRTAAAGAVAAKYLAPKTIRGIGMIGTGVQARMQLQYLNAITDCKDVIVWGRNQQNLDVYKKDMELQGYSIQAALRIGDVASNCNLIVTATASKSPLLKASQIQRGTHITAVGSDTPEKIELDPKILQKADIIVADSVEQCLTRGEISQAMNAGVLKKEDVAELGDVIVHEKLHRSSEDQITVADLTGVAIQDIQISKAVCQALFSHS